MTRTAWIDCHDCDCPHEFEYEFEPASVGGVYEAPQHEYFSVLGVGSKCNGLDCDHVFTEAELKVAARADMQEQMDMEREDSF